MKMQHFAVCDTAKQVLWRVSVPVAGEDQEAEPPVPADGQAVYSFEEDEWPGAPCYIDDDGVLHAGYSPERDVSTARSQKIEEIASWHVAAQSCPFTFGEFTFQMDPASRDALSAYIQSAQSAKLLGTEFSVTYRLADNREVGIARDDWLALSAALAVHRDSLNTRKQRLKRAATQASLEELTNIRWE
jgi:hypothetical protein